MLVCVLPNKNTTSAAVKMVSNPQRRRNAMKKDYASRFIFLFGLTVGALLIGVLNEGAGEAPAAGRPEIGD